MTTGRQPAKTSADGVFSFDFLILIFLAICGPNFKDLGPAQRERAACGKYCPCEGSDHHSRAIQKEVGAEAKVFAFTTTDNSDLAIRKTCS